MKGVFRMGTTYTNYCMGFLNPYATPTEFPYPLYIGGSSGRPLMAKVPPAACAIMSNER